MNSLITVAVEVCIALLIGRCLYQNSRGKFTAHYFYTRMGWWSVGVGLGLMGLSMMNDMALKIDKHGFANKPLLVWLVALCALLGLFSIYMLFAPEVRRVLRAVEKKGM